jgi:hypothetical protein
MTWLSKNPKPLAQSFTVKRRKDENGAKNAVQLTPIIVILAFVLVSQVSVIE